MKQDEKDSNISNILLPWQQSRFEHSLIRNTIISFSTSQSGHNGIFLALGVRCLINSIISHFHAFSIDKCMFCQQMPPVFLDSDKIFVFEIKNIREETSN